MAKMSRNGLKSLVKECLFEILLESTESNTGKITEARKVLKSDKKLTSRRPALDMITNNPQRTATPKKLDVSHLTEDPIMAAIFQDTAATTLVEQSDAERGKVARGAGDAAARTASQSDPTQLFGAAAQNWAALAFDDK
jgi:hypothetical protein|tara:strand:+ start:811 stop:1227 length:417 start_codon:yes stop_codon:yes gene_type:complete